MAQLGPLASRHAVLVSLVERRQLDGAHRGAERGGGVERVRRLDERRLRTHGDSRVRTAAAEHSAGPGLHLVRGRKAPRRRAAWALPRKQWLRHGPKRVIGVLGAEALQHGQALPRDPRKARARVFALDAQPFEVGAQEAPAALRPPRCRPSRTPLLLHLTLGRRLIELLQKLLHIKGLLLCRGLGDRLAWRGANSRDKLCHGRRWGQGKCLD